MVPLAGAVVGVACGGGHTCAWESDGSVYCWGKNNNGQVGDGTNVQRLSPVPVAAAGFGKVTALVASYNHTCALMPDDSVDCWGRSSNLILSDTPEPVPGLHSATPIAVGSLHTCAMLSNGTVDCWGNNQYGQLGDGTTTYRSSPAPVLWP